MQISMVRRRRVAERWFDHPFRFRNDLGRSRRCLDLGTEQSEVSAECSKTTRRFSQSDRSMALFQCVAKLSTYLTSATGTNDPIGLTAGQYCVQIAIERTVTLFCNSQLKLIVRSFVRRNTPVVMLILNITKHTKCIPIAKSVKALSLSSSFVHLRRSDPF